MQRFIHRKGNDAYHKAFIFTCQHDTLARYPSRYLRSGSSNNAPPRPRALTFVLFSAATSPPPPTLSNQPNHTSVCHDGVLFWVKSRKHSRSWCCDAMICFCCGFTWESAVVGPKTYPSRYAPFSHYTWIYLVLVSALVLYQP